MDYLTTGRLAKKANVNIETIRFYERKGLIPVPVRNESGYRTYSPETANRVMFIKNAQDLGFTLREINELLELKVSSTKTCTEVRNRTLEKIGQVEEKIRNLAKIKKSLNILAMICLQKEPTSECPILDYFYMTKRQ